MPRDTFKDVQDDVDLRTVGARIQFIRKEERRVNGLHEGQVISYHNKAGTRFRHLIKWEGQTRLMLSPFDPKDKYSLALQESENLAKLAVLKKHREAFEAIAEGTREKKERSDAWKKSRKKKKKK